MAAETSASGGKTVSAAFGAKNRHRLIDAYFAEQPSELVTADHAWVHVYRLLLWVDQTTGLGHCYESDKSQPGKNWYSRSLAFHDWVSSALVTTPANVAHQIDWLFKRAAEDLARHVLGRAQRVAVRAEEQRKPYEGRGFPKPGEDPELVDMVRGILGAHFATEPPPDVWERLVQTVRQYLALENKRKNLVGEGFEDVIAQVVRRTCKRRDMEVFTRRVLHDLPGFHRSRAGTKQNKVDVSILRPAERTLVTAKWSVRADREKQFVTDFTEYLAAESENKPFEYVFVTNEFDAARLMRACEQLASNSLMFKHVVHISTDAIRATYGAGGNGGDTDSMRAVLKHIDSGRLISLGQWLKCLEHGANSAP